MERLKTIVGILLAIGVIFGTFDNFAAGTPLGFAWFVNLLWFVIGFPVLLGLGWFVFTVLILGEQEAKKLGTKEK